jgi:hypothetical protein
MFPWALWAILRWVEVQKGPQNFQSVKYSQEAVVSYRQSFLVQWTQRGIPTESAPEPKVDYAASISSQLIHSGQDWLGKS